MVGGFGCTRQREWGEVFRLIVWGEVAIKQWGGLGVVGDAVGLDNDLARKTPLWLRSWNGRITHRGEENHNDVRKPCVGAAFVSGC